MSDPDRLARIKAALADDLGVTRANMEFLLGELKERDQQAERLRSLLRDIEWVYIAASHGEPQTAECPACWGVESGGHEPDCRLAAEIHPPTPSRHE